MTDTKKLKSLLALRGINQQELANLLHISVQSLNYKINNKRHFSTNEIVKLCKLLDLHNDADICSIFLQSM